MYVILRQSFNLISKVTDQSSRSSSYSINANTTIALLLNIEKKKFILSKN
jgi:hypothetical protein